MEPVHDEIQAALLKEFGLEGFPVAAQQEALAALAGPVIQAVTLAIMEKLPPEQHEPYQAALLSGDGKTVARIIADHIPDSTAFLEAETRKAIDELKAHMPA